MAQFLISETYIGLTSYAPTRASGCILISNRLRYPRRLAIHPVGNRADIYLNAGQYCLTLNMHSIANGSDPENLKREAERHIIARVRKMMPAYKAIYARARTP